MDLEYVTLINCLRELRTTSGCTQQRLAERLGTKQSYVRKYELCRHRLDVVELRRIVRALGTPLPVFICNYEIRLKRLGID